MRDEESVFGFRFHRSEIFLPNRDNYSKTRSNFAEVGYFFQLTNRFTSEVPIPCNMQKHTKTLAFSAIPQKY